jgi:hypothetical protein
MWECEFERMKKNDSSIRNYVKNHPYVTITPLQPRDSFYGGRVNATRLHCKADISKGCAIYYLDVKSLYPTVNKVTYYVNKYLRKNLHTICIQNIEMILLF